ncbi:MAG: hypothetical protein AAFR64_12445 [Pseudomonadota bacterium]
MVEAPEFSLSDDQPQEMVDWVVALTDSWDAASTDQEAEALIKLLSRSDDDFFGVAWTIIHFIETAPNWPNWSALEKVSGEWADILRVRLKNAGLMPPPSSQAADL